MFKPMNSELNEQNAMRSIDDGARYSGLDPNNSYIRPNRLVGERSVIEGTRSEEGDTDEEEFF
jgi:hypothetical protein